MADLESVVRMESDRLIFVQAWVSLWSFPCELDIFGPTGAKVLDPHKLLFECNELTWLLADKLYFFWENCCDDLGNTGQDSFS